MSLRSGTYQSTPYIVASAHEPTRPPQVVAHDSGTHSVAAQPVDTD